MPKVRSITSARPHAQATSSLLEWAGACVPLPNYVLGEGEPYRPDLAVWMEFPSDLVVGFEMASPGDDPPLAKALAKALKRPMAGPPRRPDRIRVPDASLAAQIRELAAGIDVVVAPTPEIDAAVALMGQGGPAHPSRPRPQQPSYLEGGRIPEELMRGLFEAARTLWAIAPWKGATHHHLVRVDVPSLDVNGACLMEIGSLGESIGFLLFPSEEGYESYAQRAEAAVESGEEVEDLGTSVLSLEFDPAKEVPAAMRREVKAHGWTLSGKDRYPRIFHRDPDGLERPLVTKDLKIVTAIATSLASMCLKHPRLFREDLDEPLCESWFDDEDLEVRFTVPYEAGRLFEANQGEAETPRSRTSAPAPSRNAPCPCGSGRKYKRCCLAKDRASAGAAAPSRESLMDLDDTVTRDLVRFAQRHLGPEWEAVFDGFAYPTDAMMPLLMPWSVYSFLAGRTTVADHYVDQRGPRLSPAVREFLEAQRESWLSVWEVTRTDAGKGLSVTDLLSGTSCYVSDIAASRSLRQRDAILARVLRHDALAIFSGMHGKRLPPDAAAEVVRRARGRLRRKGDVPVERLRNEAFGRYLIRAWDEAVAVLEALSRLPHRMQNTDGDAIRPTTDHFTFDPARRADVEARIAAMEGVAAEPATAGERVFTVEREGNAASAGLSTTLIGTIVVSAKDLLVETNSVKRANRLRTRLETACGDLIRRGPRKHDQEIRPPRIGGVRASGPPLPPETIAELVREQKARHYATWPDEPVPALGGRTPRDAMRTREGREQVEVLLKMMENDEARGVPDQAYDFAQLRAELGIGG